MSPPLRVPLEVLERILFFAFTPLASPSSSSSSLPVLPITSKDLLAPPLGTSHLLLVSKGFRQLALPHYYSVVSIVKGRDCQRTFLDPERGLLIGEDNDERASFVKELWINVTDGARVPIDLELLRSTVHADRIVVPDRLLVELETTLLPRLDHLVCFSLSKEKDEDEAESFLTVLRDSMEDGDGVYQGVDTDDSEKEATWALLQVMVVKIAESWNEGKGEEDEPWDVERCFKEVRVNPEWEEYVAARMEALPVDDSEHREDHSEKVDAVREGAFKRFMDRTLPPREGLAVALDVNFALLRRQLLHLGLGSSTSDTSLLVYPPVSLDLATEEGRGVALDAVRSGEGVAENSDLPLLFEGYPRSFWECANEYMEEEEEQWSEKWMWRSEDGTVVSLKETFGGSKV